MLLVDTCIWVNHLRKRLPDLQAALLADQVVCHPFVIGELACGNMHRRAEILLRLQQLPAIPKSEDDEVLYLIDHHRLMGRGLGLIDAHLLASCLLTGTALWTADRRLTQAARDLGLAVA